MNSISTENATTSVSRQAWRASRYGFLGFWLGSLLVLWLVLRLVFFAQFHPPAPVGEDFLAFLDGFYRDCLVGLWMSLPVFAWLALVPGRWFPTRSHGLVFWSACTLFWFVEIFLLFVEYFFFDEFKSRFNTVAVDYLQYPREVFVNIWESYHVGIVIGGCFVLALCWVLIARKVFRPLWDKPAEPLSVRLKAAAAFGLIVALTPLALIAGSLTGVMSSPLHLKGARVSADRTLNEIANNGALSFFAAALTHHLDYTAFYKTLPREEAYKRARELLAEPGCQFVEQGTSIRRHIQGDSSRPRLNVVIFLEESFGSEFWGCLGRTNTLTPEMDKLAADEGLLFTNIYATGNRTVRGMEGVLSSFPPLPGDSIVKRDLSDDVETVARVLKRDGYQTVFLYGGRGVFDGMRSFAVRNGYDRFIEQKHFEHPTFTTIWGVCDEDLYARSVEEFREMAKGGQPFFATVLSVSNHKPYTYPKGRIPENPDEQKRENAVKYSDFALGEFFRAAKKEAFWTNTVFVVVADHGARVYGEQSVPIHSYEIPLLIAGPAVVKTPQRLGQLGCSLDVAPTALGLVGRPYDSLFFGRDLLKLSPPQGRALLNHNRDIGLLARDRMVVLGLMQTEEFYSGDPKRIEMKPLLHPEPTDRQLEENAMSLFQIADELYMHQQYRLNALPPAAVSLAPSSH